MKNLRKFSPTSRLTSNSPGNPRLRSPVDNVLIGFLRLRGTQPPDPRTSRTTRRTRLLPDRGNETPKPRGSLPFPQAARRGAPASPALPRAIRSPRGQALRALARARAYLGYAQRLRRSGPSTIRGGFRPSIRTAAGRDVDGIAPNGHPLRRLLRRAASDGDEDGRGTATIVGQKLAELGAETIEPHRTRVPYP